MYGIFTNIYPKNHPNVGKYTIHGAYGYYQLIITNPTQAPEAATPAAEFNASSGFLQRVPEDGTWESCRKNHGEFNFDGDVYMILYVTLNIKLNMKFHGRNFRFTGLKSGLSE